MRLMANSVPKSSTNLLLRLLTLPSFTKWLCASGDGRL